MIEITISHDDNTMLIHGPDGEDAEYTLHSDRDIRVFRQFLDELFNRVKIEDEFLTLKVINEGEIIYSEEW